MPTAYNPIVRTFCRIRSGLCDSMKLARHDVRPNTPLEAILPPGSRRRAWTELRHRGLRVPALKLSGRYRIHNLFWTLKTALSVAWSLQRLTAMVIALPMALIVLLASRLGPSRSRSASGPWAS